MNRKVLVLALGTSLFCAAATAQTKPAPAKPDPALATCMGKLGPTYASIRDIMAKGRVAGEITKAEEAIYASYETARQKDWAAKQQGGVTTAECEAHLKGLEGEKARVTGMATSVRTCMSKLSPTYASIREVMANGRKAGQITKAEEEAFAKMEADRTKDWAAKSKDGVTVAECEAHLKGLEAEKARVVVMATAVQNCFAKLGPTMASIRDIMAKGRQAKNITPAEEAEFAKMEEGRSKDWAAKMKDGITVAECEAHLKGMESEKARVTVMAGRAPTPDPKLATCMSALASTYSSIQTTMRNGRAANQITPAEEAEFNRIEAARAKDWAAKQQGGVTVAECESHLNSMKGEAARVTGMAARPPVKK